MEKSMPIAVMAVIISIIAIASAVVAVVLKPTLAIGAGAVGTNELADSSVTGDKIFDGTITDADLTSTGVSRIANGAVGSDQVADNAITLQKLSPDVIVTLENIADNSITSAKITDGTITNVDISSAAAIDLSKLATHPFGLSDLSPDSVDDTKIVDGSVTSADVQDGAIQTTDIAAGALTQIAENWALPAVDTTTATWGSYEDLDNARVEITTGNNPVLIMFSGTFSNDTAGGEVWIWLMIDGSDHWRTSRKGTSSAANEPFTLAFNYVPTLSASTHTIQVVWCLPMGAGGQTGTADHRTLDVIELKR